MYTIKVHTSEYLIKLLNCVCEQTPSDCRLHRFEPLPVVGPDVVLIVLSIVFFSLVIIIWMLQNLTKMKMMIGRTATTTTTTTEKNGCH